MIDTVAALNGATIAAAANREANFTAVDLAAKTSWAHMALHLEITNPATVCKQGERVTIFYALTSFANVASADPLRSCAKQYTLQLPTAADAKVYLDTPPLLAHGSKLYIWFEHDEWSGARTVTVNAAGSAA